MTCVTAGIIAGACIIARVTANGANATGTRTSANARVTKPTGIPRYLTFCTVRASILTRAALSLRLHRTIRVYAILTANPRITDTGITGADSQNDITMLERASNRALL